MPLYISKKPMVAVIPPESQKERLDTFFYHYLFADLDEKLKSASNEMVPAEEASTFITDGTHQTPTYAEKENGVLFLSSTNIDESGIDLSECKYITVELHRELKNCQPRGGDVLIAKSGTVGTACVFPENLPECSVYESVAIFRPSDDWLPEFVAAFINSDFGVRQIQRSQKGIAIKHLHLGDLKELWFPQIDKDDQKLIVERLNRIRSLSKEVENKALLVESQRQQMLDLIAEIIADEIGLPHFPKPWFGKIYIQPAEAGVDRIDVLGANTDFENMCEASGKFGLLGDVCEIDGTNQQIPIGLQRYISIEELPGNFWGKIELPEVEIEEQTGRTHFLAGDIAWAHLKPSILQGKAFIINEECWGSHHFLRLSTSYLDENMRTIIWAYLKTGPIKRHLANKCTGKSESQKDVNDRALAQLPFPVLSQDQARRIAEGIREKMRQSHELEIIEGDYRNRASYLLNKAKANIFNLLDGHWFNRLVEEAKEALQ